MIISILSLTFLDGQAQAGLAAVHQALKSTRGFDGCLGIDVARDINDPHRVSIIERWKSLEHDTAYREWAAKQSAVSPLKGLLAGPPSKAICEFLADI
jgi:quinol monooxygenase YgiN